MKSRAANNQARTAGAKLLSMVVALLLAAAACGSTDVAEVDSASGDLKPLEEITQPASDTSGEATREIAEPATNPTEWKEGDPDFGATLTEFFDDGTAAVASTPAPEGFTEIQWEDLVPPGFSDADITARFEERIAEVEIGSPEADKVYAELQAEFDNQPINPDAARDDIFLAGFVAPLTFENDLVTEFLLVPYFGACIHVPPPPPNQTILVKLAEGEALALEDSWGAVWVTGSLTVDGATTELADAGYSISGASSGVYESL